MAQIFNYGHLSTYRKVTKRDKAARKNAGFGGLSYAAAKSARIQARRKNAKG